MTQPLDRQGERARLAVLEEAARKLVEGRYNPDSRDRSDQFWDNEGQWTVWLTREEHERYREALDG